MPRLAPIASLFAVLAVLVAGCGSGTAASGDDPASAVPRDAAMYFDATIRPEGQQRNDALAAAGKVLATPAPQAKIESLIQQALDQSDGLKLDYARDIKPWLGAKAAFWLAPSRANQGPRGAAVIASTDKDAAQAALDRAVKGSGQTFSKRSAGGVTYEVNSDGGAVAATDAFVVLGGEAELKRTLETLDGGSPLSGDDRYKAAVGRLAPDRLGTMYLDLKSLLDAAADRDPRTAQQLQQLKRVLPVDSVGAISGALTADGEKIALDAVTPGGRAFVDRFGAGTTPLLGELPADSWAAYGLPRFGQTVQLIYQQAAGALGGSVLEQQLRSQLGLDLQQDVFSWIGDVAFFARGVTKGSVDGGVVIQVTDVGRARAAFGKLVGLAQSRGGASAKAVSVPGADIAFAFSAPDAERPVVAALGEGRVVITSGEAAAAEALAPKAKLADSETWNQAKAALGDGYEPLFLLSMPAAVELAGASAGSDADFARAKPYLDAFSLIAGGGKLDGDTLRSRFVAGLK